MKERKKDSVGTKCRSIGQKYILKEESADKIKQSEKATEKYIYKGKMCKPIRLLAMSYN